MDWRMFFFRIKFFRYIKLFIVSLMILGTILIINGYNNLISATLIYFLAVLICYLKSIGVFIIWIEKNYRREKYIFIDNMINITIAILFGWRFVILLGWSFLGYVIYIALWAFYIKYTYPVFDNVCKRYDNKKMDR